MKALINNVNMNQHCKTIKTINKIYHMKLFQNIVLNDACYYKAPVVTMFLNRFKVLCEDILVGVFQ